MIKSKIVNVNIYFLSLVLLRLLINKNLDTNKHYGRVFVTLTEGSILQT